MDRNLVLFTMAKFGRRTGNQPVKKVWYLSDRRISATFTKRNHALTVSSGQSQLRQNGGVHIKVETNF